MGRTRNAVYWRRYRGFESLLLRKTFGWAAKLAAFSVCSRRRELVRGRRLFTEKSLKGHPKVLQRPLPDGRSQSLRLRPP